MWISNIELTNFKCYRSQTFSFPQPTEGKNLVLVGGMNGYGKTTILEAIYLCLYGSDAITHLGRAGLKSTEERKGYPTFLERAFNGEASASEADSMSVKIKALSEPNTGFELSRRWFFNKHGNWTNEEEVLLQIIENGQSSPADKEDVRETLDQSFVPAHLAPFFFFDGEEVKTLADRNHVEQIKQGMEGLLGVTILRGVKRRLEQYQTSNRHRHGTNRVSEKKFEELSDKLEQSERQLAGLISQRDLIYKKCADDKLQLGELADKMVSLGGGNNAVAAVKETITQKGKVEIELNDCEKKVQDMLSSKLPFHLIREGCIENLKKQLDSEIIKSKWDASKRAMEPKKENFISRFFKDGYPEIKPALNDSQDMAIRGRLDEAWEGLFHPPPVGCAENIIHDYMPDKKRELLLELIYKQLNIGAQDIQSLVQRRQSLQHELNELEKRLQRVDDLDKSSTMSRIKNDWDKLSKSVQKHEHELGDYERQIATLKADVSNNKAVHGRMRQQIIEASPVKSNIDRAQRVNALITELMPKLYTLRTNELGSAITKVYKMLAHKSQVDKIEIDEDGTSCFLSKDGNQINFDRSAGENQLFATALLAGLAEISGIEAPLVVDTPLARLDGKHRGNILNFWTKQRNRQVILLAQDKEIDQEIFSQIESNVCQSYLLEHTDLGDGIGRAVAHEGKYFDGAV